MVSFPRLPALAGTLAGLAALVGLWGTAGRAEARLIAATDAALARHAAAYLAAVAPADSTGVYDATRLLAIVNDLAAASFWPGGLQVAVGETPLIVDTVGLVPLPDTTIARLATVGATVIIPGGPVVSIVPLADPGGTLVLGWVAAWHTVASHRGAPHSVALTLLAGVACLVLALDAGDRGRRRRGVLLAAGLVGLVGLDTAWGLRGTARRATDAHLLTLGRLVQVASTRVGLRQALVPEIAVGVGVRSVADPGDLGAKVTRGRDDSGPVARLVASTPRTRRGIELSVRPAEAGLGRVWAVLAAWVLVAVGGLALVDRRAVEDRERASRTDGMGVRRRNEEPGPGSRRPGGTG